jgi:hypothetical protein
MSQKSALVAVAAACALAPPISACAMGRMTERASSLEAVAQNDGLPPRNSTDMPTASGPGGDSKQIVIDLVQLGIKCDGRTDDTAALQVALTRAQGMPGAIVEFPSRGTCMIARALSVPSHTTLHATPGSVVLMPARKNTSTPLLISIKRQQEIRVDGLSFDGGGSDFPNDTAVARIIQSSDIVFDHTVWRNTRGNAILFNEVSQGGVQNSYFENIGNYWRITLRQTDRRSAVTFCECGSVEWNQDNFVTGSRFSDLGLDGISASRQSNFVASQNNFVLDSNEYMIAKFPHYPAGVFVTFSVGGKIARNIIRGAPGNCIDVVGTNSLVISNNKVQQCGAAGIAFFGGDNAEILNNDSVDNWQSGRRTSLMHSAQRGAFTLGATAGDTARGVPAIPLGRVTLAGNDGSDTQQTATQQWGIQVLRGPIVGPIRIGEGNRFKGNALGDMDVEAKRFSVLR